MASITTDITELAQSLKAAAEKATQGNWRAFKYHDGRCGIGGGHHDEIMVCEHISKRRPHDAEFIALANPANILALVEALEKAQQRIAELDSRAVNVKLLTPEVRNALKAEGLADVLKDAAEYAPLTVGQWETLTKNWYQTFIGLSGSAAGIKVEAE